MITENFITILLLFVINFSVSHNIIKFHGSWMPKWHPYIFSTISSFLDLI